MADGISSQFWSWFMAPNFVCVQIKNGFKIHKIENLCAQCLKITEKVSCNIASEASYVYNLSGQKLAKNAKNGQFWRVFKT